MFKFIESVFARDVALFNTDTNQVLLKDTSMSYEDFDKESFVTSIYTIDEYNFKVDLDDLLYIEHVYDNLYIDYYSPAPECYF